MYERENYCFYFERMLTMENERGAIKQFSLQKENALEKRETHCNFEFYMSTNTMTLILVLIAGGRKVFA